MSDQTPPQLGRHAAAGAAWLTVQKWAVRLSGFVTIAILTRILTPSDFGIVAAASTVLPFFILLADLGFAAYIVQADRLDDRLLSTGFWFSTLAGLALCGTLIAAAPWLGLAFGGGEVVIVLQALSVSVIFIGLGAVPLSLLRRRMEFQRLAKQGVAAAVIAQIVAIVMAVMGLGVWALVGQAVTSPLATGLLAWVAAGWRPRLMFSWSDFATMARFGSQVLAVEFVAMARAWGEAAIISSTLGMAALGYLSVAQRLVQVVQDMTGAALVPVTTVAFAKLRSSPDRVRSVYLRALRLTYAALSSPLTLVAVSAPILVPIIFGAGWEPSYTLTQILALAGILVVGATLDHGLFYGLGRPGRWFWYALVIDVVTVAVTAVAVHWGLVAVATGFLLVAALATLTRWFLVARLISIRPMTAAGPFGYLTVAVLASGSVGWLVSLISGPPALVSLILMGLAVLTVHLLVTWMVARPVYDDVVGLVEGSRWARLVPGFITKRVRRAGNDDSAPNGSET